MRLKVQIELNAREIREAIIEAAIKKINIGHALNYESDVVIHSLSLDESFIEIVPGREAPQKPKKNQTVPGFYWCDTCKQARPENHICSLPRPFPDK